MMVPGVHQALAQRTRSSCSAQGRQARSAVQALGPAPKHASLERDATATASTSSGWPSAPYSARQHARRRTAQVRAAQLVSSSQATAGKDAHDARRHPVNGAPGGGVNGAVHVIAQPSSPGQAAGLTARLNGSTAAHTGMSEEHASQQVAQGQLLAGGGDSRHQASHTSGQGGDLDLLDEIKSCETWCEVLDVVEDEAQRMSLFSAAQAATRIVAILRKGGQSSRNQALPQISARAGFATLTSLLFNGISSMSRAQVANSVTALASLQVPFTEAHAAAYAARIRQLAPELNARDVVQLLHGFSIAPSGSVMPRVSTLDRLGYRATQLLGAGQVEPQGISMLLVACAGLEYKNSHLLAAATAAAVQDISNFTPQGVASSARALARLGYYSHAFLTAALQHFSENSAGYKPQEVCTLMWTLAQLRHHPQDALPAMVRSLVDRAPTLGPQDFASLLYTLGTFGVHPGPKAMAALAGPLTRALPRFNAVELCNCYWGLGLIGEAGSPAAAAIASKLPDHFAAGHLTDSLLRQAFQGLLCAKLEAADRSSASEGGPALSKKAQQQAAQLSGLEVSFPPLMLQSMKRAWVTSVRLSTGAASGPGPGAAGEEEEAHQDGSATADQGGQQDQEPSSSSRPVAQRAAAPPRSSAQSVKQELGTILDKLRVPHDAGRSTRDGLVTIDFALQPSDERFVAMQVVMEHEHTCNTGQLLGPLQFQARVLEMNGWEVRYVRAKDLKALEPRSKPLFIADLLQAVGCRVAAVPTHASRGGRGSAVGSRSRRGPGGQGEGAGALDLLVSEGVPLGKSSRSRASKGRS